MGDFLCLAHGRLIPDPTYAAHVIGCAYCLDEQILRWTEMLRNDGPPPREWLKEKLAAYYWKGMLDNLWNFVIPEKVAGEFGSGAPLPGPIEP